MADGNVCVRCDTCGIEFRGEPFDRVAKVNRPMGHGILGANSLRAEAYSLGWTGRMTHDSDTDKCPKCSANVELTGEQVKERRI